jgi:hypothetical protein
MGPPEFTTVLTTARHWHPILHPFHPPRFDHSNNIWRASLQSPVASCVSLQGLNDPLSNLISHPQPTSLPYGRKLSATHAPNRCLYTVLRVYTTKERTNHCKRSPDQESNPGPPESEVVVSTAQALKHDVPKDRLIKISSLRRCELRCL